MNWFGNFLVLDGQGPIALAERGLMLHAVEFMLIVAIPVFALLFFFAWHYRAGKKKAKYTPNWEHSKMEELVWWAIPFEIILILGALTWTSTHELDPRKPIAGETPLVVQAIALEWKWLFLYPEAGVASVNHVYMPVGRPVRFDITADAPMNSFWIPQLGGQLYAMTGMTNSLNLRADSEGEYKGVSANYSGVGFAQMEFTAKAVLQEQFDSWVEKTKSSGAPLNEGLYARLLIPGKAQVDQYRLPDHHFYDMILAKYMDQTAVEPHMH